MRTFPLSYPVEQRQNNFLFSPLFFPFQCIFSEFWHFSPSVTPTCKETIKQRRKHVVMTFKKKYLVAKAKFSLDWYVKKKKNLKDAHPRSIKKSNIKNLHSLHFHKNILGSKFQPASFLGPNYILVNLQVSITYLFTGTRSARCVCVCVTLSHAACYLLQSTVTLHIP